MRTARAESDPPKPSILIVLAGSLGDVVRGFYLADHIKRALPGARLSWLVEPKTAPLVRMHPAVDAVVVFQRQRGLAGVVE